MFCLVWRFGGSLAEDSRLLFDIFLKDLLASHKSSVKLPAKGTVYDYFVDLSKLEWCEWCNDNSSMSLTEKKKLEHVLVRSVESVSVIFFARLMLHHSCHCLFHGPETSKTMLILEALLRLFLHGVTGSTLHLRVRSNKFVNRRV